MQAEGVEERVLRPLGADPAQDRQDAVDLLQPVERNRCGDEFAGDEIARGEAEEGGDLGQDPASGSALLARMQDPAVELHRQVADDRFLEREGMGILLDQPAAEGFLQGLHGLLGGRADELDLDADRAHFAPRVVQDRRQGEIDVGRERRLRHRELQKSTRKRER